MSACALWIAASLMAALAAGHIETVTVSGCESCTLRLTCRHLTAVIAVWEARFEPAANATPPPAAFAPAHPQHALNRRCSGVNHCSFILTQDCPGADTWGRGTLTVRYACVPEHRIKTFCNSEIVLDVHDKHDIAEGFIRNPGYPRFYASQRRCRWRIRAAMEQRIRITILDISVTGEPLPDAEGCADHLEVVDSGQVIDTTCRAELAPRQILSASSEIELVLVASHHLTPLRGVLVHYAAVGCATPEPPGDGYLMHRNGSVAEFRCCVGFIFPDSGARSKIIKCLGAFWDAELPLPDCQREYSPFQKTKIFTDSIMASDILAPALLIVALFLINFVVLFYIYKKKRQHGIEKCTLENVIYEDEEMGTLEKTTLNEGTSP